MSPLVSVILTVYQRTGFLAQALESALQQSFDHYEIIVADDSGTAAARDICQPHVDTGRIRYRANRENMGIANSLRAAMQEASGRYVAILNDDDRWERDFLAQLVPPLERDTRRVLAFSDHWIITEAGAIDHAATDANARRYGRADLAEGPVPNTAEFVLLRNGVPLAMAAVFRKDAFDSRLLTSEVAGAYDFWISCLLAASGGAFYYVPKRLSRYRLHAGMESGRRSPEKSENQVYIFRQLLERHYFAAMEPYLRSRLAEALYRVGRDRLYFNRLIEARRYFRSALAMRTRWEPLVACLLSFCPHAVRKALRVSDETMPKA